MGSIDGTTDWTRALEGVDCIVHAAARVHVMHESSATPLAAFRIVNVDGTRRLAEQAAKVGVRRLIYLSSIKVNGESSLPGRPIAISDPATPLDDYGVSKWEAEQALREVAERTGLEVVIVRPPLVYGPGVKGNFARLVTLVQRGIPLPLMLVRNKRSLVGIGNLVDLLAICVVHPRAAGRTFLVSDGHDLSTPELLRHIAEAMDRPSRMFPLPTGLMRAGAALLGARMKIDRLLGWLQVDIQQTCAVLNWSPPVDVKDELRILISGHRHD